MEQRPAFKKQLLGLEQDAVFQYIEQMSRTASESEQKLREQIDQVTRSREELEGQIASFEEKHSASGTAKADTAVSADCGSDKLAALVRELVIAMKNQ